MPNKTKSPYLAYSPKISRYAYGMQTYIHKGHVTTASVGSQDWDNYLVALSYLPSQIGNVPPEFEHRPDLISNVWYGSTGLWWLVMVMNNLFDPFEELDRGDPILLPKD